MTKNLTNKKEAIESDLNKSLFTIEEVAVELKMSSEEIKELIKKWDICAVDVLQNPIFCDSNLGFEDNSINIDSDGIRVTRYCIDLYLRQKEHRDAVEAFYQAISKFDLVQEEIEFIRSTYAEMIYYSPKEFLNNECTRIYQQFRELQKNHPENWQHYIDLDHEQNWNLPREYFINKNNEMRKIWDYINYLKITGPEDELNDFEDKFTKDTFPTLAKLMPIPLDEDLKSQTDACEIFPEKIVGNRAMTAAEKEYKIWNWCLYNWGPTYDIEENSIKVYGVRGKNKLFTLFNTEPIESWLNKIQQMYPKLTFLTYYRSWERNMWHVEKTKNINGVPRIEYYQGGDISDVFNDPKIQRKFMKHEMIIRRIIEFDNWYRPIDEILKTQGILSNKFRAHNDFE